MTKLDVENKDTIVGDRTIHVSYDVDVDILKYIDNSEFIWFLRWLDEEHNWSASEIISVVQRPSGYQKQFTEYMQKELGGHDAVD
jgi:hypothetical protein